MSNTTDKRALRTKNSIIAELKQMICEMECNQITVKALTERIGINRKTFYRHFDSIDTLFDTLIDELSAGYVSKVEATPGVWSLSKQNEVFFDYYCNQEPYVEKLFLNQSYRFYSQRLPTKSVEKYRAAFHPFQNLPVERQAIIEAFRVNALSGIFAQWIQGGKKMSVDELKSLAGTLVVHGCSCLIPSTKL